MLNKEIVQMLREKYTPGTRIYLRQMGSDPRPIPSGTKGTVRFVDDAGTIHCAFDNNRLLGLIFGEDVFCVLREEA